MLEELAGYAQSPLGSGAIRALVPHPDGMPEALEEVAEVRELSASRGYAACGQAESLDEILDRARVEGVVLDLAELVRYVAQRSSQGTYAGTSPQTPLGGRGWRNCRVPYRHSARWWSI
ncbi:MAG: hypothetical protein GKS06_10680 [Acidobacteria bacterium]|nr:hypothetical protein [Acidobacteriota bacterium]